MNDIVDKIKKIRALAERGVGGEKVTAQKKLDKLLRDNNLSLESLEEDSIQYYLFSYKDDHSAKLLSQVIYKVLGTENGKKLYKSRGTRLKIGVYCTPAQKIEIDLEYEFYLNLFNYEVEQLLSAFIQEQDIFPDDCPVDKINLTDLSDEDRDKIIKQEMYRKNIKKQSRTIMIESKS